LQEIVAVLACQMKHSQSAINS